VQPERGAIDDYIEQNKARYTSEAMRDQLLAAGHDPRGVDEALKRLAAPSESARPAGWRPGWTEFALLLVVGAIGAAIVWAGQPYGAGGIAPIVYAIVVSIGFGIAKFLSITIDQAGSGPAAIYLVIATVGALLISTINGFALPILAAAAGAGVLAVVFFFLRGSPRTAGMIGAALPIVVWLLITGTCYAPLLSSG
jgi:hypothetical protein